MNTQARHTFPKREKLCGQLRIQALYKQGRRFMCWPLRVNYLFTPLASSQTSLDPEVLIWAPKSIFHHAVDRNRMRRLMREAYRLNNASLKAYCEEHDVTLQLAFNYADKQVQDYATVERAMRKAIRKLTSNE